MQSKILRYIIGLAAAFTMFLLGWSYASAPTLPPATVNTSHTVDFLLDDGTKIEGYQHQAIPVNEPTVLGVLKEVAAKDNLKLEVDTSSSMGAFIMQIGAQKNGQGTKYWQYWVNGAQPMIAADKYQLKGGETILWTFRKSAM